MVQRFKYFTILFISTLIILFGCERLSNELPVADFTISPPFGDRETVFLFDAGEIEDDETETWRLKVRWDADSDGDWDSDYSVEKKFAYKFASDGEHSITLEVLDSYGGITQVSKTVSIAPILLDSSMTDPRDGQIYRTVRLWGKWYMAENLRYGQLLDSGAFPSDNKRTEAYASTIDSTRSSIYGYYYSWDEATDYKRENIHGVCPEGWHILNFDELLELNAILRKIINKAEFLGENGKLHLDIPLSGRYFYPGGDWDHQNFKGYFWINQDIGFPQFHAWAYYNGKDTICARSEYYSVSWVNHWKKEWGEFTYQKIALPVRCVKN